MRAPALAVALLCTLSPVAFGHMALAQTREVPLDRQALVMLRVLAYDRNLPRRAGAEKTLTIAVVRGAAPESTRAAGEMTAALERIARASTVLGLKVRTTELEYPGAEGLDAALKATGAHAVYLTPGLEREAVQAVAEAARRSAMLAFSGTEADLGLGVAVALIRRSARVAIVINRPVVVEAGADLDPETAGGVRGAGLSRRTSRVLHLRREAGLPSPPGERVGVRGRRGSRVHPHPAALISLAAAGPRRAGRTGTGSARSRSRSPRRQQERPTTRR